MARMTMPASRRGRMGRRVIVVVPSIFTLANLFFGVWSIILASQGQFYRASWWIVIAGVLDMLDGLFARVGKAGTRFGAELDSLVDMVSFGLAPAILLYFLHFSTQGPFAWVFSYGFVVCVALRLARYNVHTTAAPKASFSGLPSPAAGMTLATFYPFTQTSLYQGQFSGLPWNQIMIFLTIALSLAMVSNVRYARLPRIGFRTFRGLAGLAVNLTILGFAVWSRDVFFFPLGIAYLSYGMMRAAVVAYLERGEDEGRLGDETDVESPQLVDSLARRRHRRRREPPGYGG